MSHQEASRQSLDPFLWVTDSVPNDITQSNENNRGVPSQMPANMVDTSTRLMGIHNKLTNIVPEVEIKNSTALDKVFLNQESLKLSTVPTRRNMQNFYSFGETGQREKVLDSRYVTNSERMYETTPMNNSVKSFTGRAGIMAQNKWAPGPGSESTRYINR